MLILSTTTIKLLSWKSTNAKHWLAGTSRHCRTSPGTLPKPQILTTSCFTRTLRTRAGSERQGSPLICSLDGVGHQAEVACDDRHSRLLLKKRTEQASWPGESCCSVPYLDRCPLSHTGRHKHRLLPNALAVPRC